MTIRLMLRSRDTGRKRFGDYFQFEYNIMTSGWVPTYYNNNNVFQTKEKKKAVRTVQPPLEMVEMLIISPVMTYVRQRSSSIRLDCFPVFNLYNTFNCCDKNRITLGLFSIFTTGCTVYTTPNLAHKHYRAFLLARNGFIRIIPKLVR